MKLLNRLTGRESNLQKQEILSNIKDICDFCEHLQNLIVALDGRCSPDHLHHLQEAKQFLNEQQKKHNLLQKEDL